MSEFWAFEFETGYYDKILEDGLNKNRGIQAGWHNITFSLLNKYVEENNVHFWQCCHSCFAPVQMRNFPQ